MFISINVSMSPNELGIIVAYYLSRYNKAALISLNFTNATEAFEKTASILGIKSNYVKFRRDEFDPIHGWRKGWVRQMDKRIVRAIEALQDLDEPILREIVKGILYDRNYREGEEVRRITSLLTESNDSKGVVGTFVVRAPTGRAAEDYFLKFYERSKLPIAGRLIDCRDFGVGYDFEIHGASGKYFIEVKGISEAFGGILLTSKEWQLAQE